MASGKIINLNDAILAVNSDCNFQNFAPYTDYSKIIWGESSPVVSKEDAEAKENNDNKDSAKVDDIENK